MDVTSTEVEFSAPGRERIPLDPSIRALITDQPDLPKYREDQARDENGRWVDEGGDPGDYASAATRWSGIRGAQIIREELRQGASEDGARLLRAIHAAPANAPELHRGISLPSRKAVTDQFGKDTFRSSRSPYPQKWYEWRTASGRVMNSRTYADYGAIKPEYQDRINERYRYLTWSLFPADETGAALPGGREAREVTLNLSGWSTNSKVAERFADRSGGVPVILSLSSGAQALDISGQSYFQDLDAENEWLTAGRFRVDNVSERGGKFQVSLTQTGVFNSASEAAGTKTVDADIVKYSPDQPRDDAGRWSADGGSPDDAATRTFSDPVAARQWLREAYSGWRADLTDAQDKALSFYQSPGYQLMNGQLRGVPVDAPAADLARARAANNHLAEAISKAPPLDAPLTVYRGFSASQWNLRVGATVTDKGFVSTSLTREQAGSFIAYGEQVLAEIRLPEGTRAAGGSVKELILPPDSSFVVTGMRTEGKQTVVQMDLVPSGQPAADIAKVDFYTEGGVVHPIRGSDGYDPEVGDRGAAPESKDTREGKRDEEPKSSSESWRRLPRENWHGPRRLKLATIQDVAERIARGVQRFEAAGGRLEMGLNRSQLFEHYHRLTERYTSDKPPTDRFGADFAKSGLTYPRGNVALDKDGLVVGGHGYSRSEYQYDRDRFGGKVVAGHGVFGTTGDVEGAGAALVYAYVKDAAEQQAGIAISPIGDAKDYWTKMGMKADRNDPLRAWGMSAGDVQRMVRAIDEAMGKPAPAKKVMLVKYSPDQPRVPAGSPEGGEFTSGDWNDPSETRTITGGGTRREPIEFEAGYRTGYPISYNPNNRPIDQPFDRNDRLFWVAADRDRLRQIRDYIDRPGTIGYKMLSLIRNAEPTDATLYRGARMPGTRDLGAQNQPPFGSVLKDYIPGQVVDLNLTSFSSDRREGFAYAMKPELQREQSERVVFELMPGAKTLEIGNTLGDTTAAEHVTTGRFVVVNVSPKQMVQSEHWSLSETYNEPVTVVGLLQVGVWNPEVAPPVLMS